MGIWGISPHPLKALVFGVGLATPVKECGGRRATRIVAGDVKYGMAVAGDMRARIEATTGCTASAGIGVNILLARLATRKAKPNGQCFISQEELLTHLPSLPVDALPGVGYHIAARLKQLDIHSCGDLQAVAKEVLQQHLGPKTGESLHNFCRGIDHRTLASLQPPRPKSVGCSINYGIRLDATANDGVLQYIEQLAVEVSQKLKVVQLKARRLTFKIKRRAPNAPEEPAKFLGHGECVDVTRSHSLAYFTNSHLTIKQVTENLWTSMKVPPNEVRGIGILMQDVKEDLSRDSAAAAAAPDIVEMLKSRPAPVAAPCATDAQASTAPAQPQGPGAALAALRPKSSMATEEIRMSQVDMDIFDSLPPDIQRELQSAMKTSHKTADISRSKITSKKRSGPGALSPSGSKAAKGLRKQRRLDEWKKSSVQPQDSAVEGVDLTVLHELPQDIQQEVLAELQQQPNDSKQQPSSAPNAHQQSPVTAPKSPTLVQHNSEGLAWEGNDDNANIDQKIAVAFQQARGFMESLDMEGLMLALRAMRRRCSQENAPSWLPRVFNTVLAYVQQLVKEQCGPLCALALQPV